MKKVNTKITVLGILATLTFGTVATSCSKNDDNDGYEQPIQGSIDPAVGTYKGKLSTSDTNGVYEWFDAIVIVTKEGSNKLKITAKSGEKYSYITPKTFTVETCACFGENTKDIVSLTGSLEGIFHYYGSNQNISVSTDEQSETDVYFEFDGVKQ
ncbi:hypothetical protein ACF8C4_17675 [Myroides odoratimimus]|uniref:hypothetical protein n=1 Tax=Myroides odoratimimus TaxID=76832 RepID=UPI00103CECB6|nr:hypothetical protein [Myroides odoratimimus]MDM1460888.1 hypothetical protein [Myroides odoratimimus]QBK77590.1 hypothetical protein E0Z07_15135 [Myroides odoratimimus]WHT73037.1 hypothetical protein QK342_15205 [Myroides odoratimimus]WHU37620.1 hypothetical protein QNM93_15190 [Myroides odoratimimus]